MPSGPAGGRVKSRSTFVAPSRLGTSKWRCTSGIGRFGIVGSSENAIVITGLGGAVLDAAVTAIVQPRDEPQRIALRARRRHDDVHPLARRDEQPIGRLRRLLQPIVGPDDIERLPFEIEEEVSTLCRVDDPPPLRRAGPHVERRHHLAVDQHVRAFAAEHHAGGTAAVGRFENAVIVEADVAQNEGQLIGDVDAILRIFYQ